MPVRRFRQATIYSGADSGAKHAAALRRLEHLLEGASQEQNARDWLTVAEVAEAIGLSDKTIRRAIYRGELRASKVRTRLRIKGADVNAWLRDNQVAIRSVAEYDGP